MHTVTLPWPDKELFPNRMRRGHWSSKRGIIRKAREIGFWTALESIGPLMEKPESVTIKFFPPDNRVRDDDGCIGAFKSYRDGVADAIKWDDRHWRPTYEFCEAEKPGKVEVIFQ